MTWEGMPHRSDEEFGEISATAVSVVDSEVTTENLIELTDGSETTLHSHPSESVTVGQLTTRVQTTDAQGGDAGFTLDVSEMSAPTSYVRFTRVLDLQGNPLEDWNDVSPYVATDGKGSIPDEVYGGGFVWTCLTGGTSDSSEPDWSSPTDGQITDNDITWGDAIAIDSYVRLLGVAGADSEGQRLTLFNDILRADVPINLIHEGGVSSQELNLPSESDYALGYHSALDLLYATGGEESYWTPGSGERSDQWRTSRRKATLNNAQIKALGDGAHPFTIVPGQGANTIIAPIFASAVYDFTAGAYSTVDPIATLNLGIAGGNSCLAWIAAQMLPDDSGPGYAHTTPFINQNVTDDGLPALSGNVYGPFAGLVDQPLQLSVSDNNGDPFTSGHADNTLTVTVFYTVVEV